MSQVKRTVPSLLEVTASCEIYTHKYLSTVQFDPKAIRLHEDSWMWQMLLLHTTKQEIFEDEDQTKIKQLKAALEFLCGVEEFRKILDLRPSMVRQSDIRRILVESDRLVAAGEFGGSGGARAMGTLRAFVFEHAAALDFRESITPQSMRFRPVAKAASKPRGLISDFADLKLNQGGGPIDALTFRDIPELKKRILDRAISDIEAIRTACIRDLETGVLMRKRALQLRQSFVPKKTLEIVQRSLTKRWTELPTAINDRIPIADQVIATLKVIDSDRLYAYCEGSPYVICRSSEAHDFLYGELGGFKSLGRFEILHHAAPEEIFAAFHLLHTYVGWNFSSVMRIDPSSIQVRDGFVTFQGYKGKTDDDTPMGEISLKEPWIEDAIRLLVWNREMLIAQGHVPDATETLWCVAGRRKKRNRPGYTFTPIQRLKDLQARHKLAKYSPDQMRGQVLFIHGLTDGGLRAAQVHAGHSAIGTTARYISQVIEQRLSSAINFEFVNRLQEEVIYLYSHAKNPERFEQLTLLKPIGDGASCVDPTSPPATRSFGDGECSAERCHSDGGCPSRRTIIDDARIEELLMTRAHYSKHWQNSWQRNPEAFVKYGLPAILYTEALHRVIQDGPYGWKLIAISSELEKRGDHE